MNVRALEWAARQNVSHAVARVLLIELALLAGDDFSCVTSLQTLASRTSRDRNTVRKWIHLLVSSGLVVREDRFADDGTRLASRYVLNHPDAHEDATSPAAEPFSSPLPKNRRGTAPFPCGPSHSPVSSRSRKRTPLPPQRERGPVTISPGYDPRCLVTIRCCPWISAVLRPGLGDSMRDDGRIIKIARGLYRKSTWNGDENLAEISSTSSQATIALRAALARHDLIDDIPDALDTAIPRGTWAPRLSTPIRWHRFDRATFAIGRDTLTIDAGRQIGMNSAPRSIIDAYRLHHLEGIDLAHDALKRWLRQGGQPSELLRMARAFPRARRFLQQALAILL